MSSVVRFDDSLPKFIDVVCDSWGREAVSENVFLREASGRLTLVVLTGQWNGDARAALGARVEQTLGAYVDGDGFSIATPDELFDDSLNDSNQGWKISIRTERFDGPIRVIDRRIVGSDWLRTPTASVAKPPRIVFASLKGGVGRSTALCVLAAHLASKGLRVLTIDMDLEAPGLGNMLLSEDTLPKFGLLDYLVEMGLNPLDEDFYVDMIGHSWLSDGKGVIDIIPALGQKSLNCPVNVLAKIARAYLGQSSPEGQVSTVADRMSALLSYYGERNEYDVMLIDARAGLHETTAAALVSLGAEVVLFGVDQPQTYAAYKVLFAHLGTLPGSDWHQRLHMVQAKAPQLNEASCKVFCQKMRDMMRATLLPFQPVEKVGIAPEEFKGIFDVEWDNETDDIPVEEIDEFINPIITIDESKDYRRFDPVINKEYLTEHFYLPVFGRFIEMIYSVVDIKDEA